MPDENSKPNSVPATAARAPRRTFLKATLGAIPAAALLAACGDGPGDSPAIKEAGNDSDTAAPGDAAPPLEQERRLALVRAHMSEENENDLDGVMATFASEPEMLFNGLPFTDLASIRAAHALMAEGVEGFSITPGPHHFTDEEVIIEGHASGTHVGDVIGFIGSGREVTLPYTAFYRFDENGKLVSERIVMDFSPLGPIG